VSPWPARGATERHDHQQREDTDDECRTAGDTAEHDPETPVRESHFRTPSQTDQLLDAWAIMAKERGLKLDHVAYWRDGGEWIRERARKPS